MPNVKISKRSVDAAEADARDSFFWDTDLKGFGLKVTARGHKTYLVQYRMGGRGTSTKRYTIGTHGAPWTPDKARQRAQELLIAVKSGIDPVHVERDQRRVDKDLAFDSYVELFIERYAKRNQPRSWHQAEQTLRYNAIPRFRSMPLPIIERKEVAAFLEDIAAIKPATARYLHATLRKMFRWAVSRGDIAFSPLAETAAPAPAASRDRVLTDQELCAVWRATQKMGFPFAPSIRLLVATGQRREEVGGMRWEELDLHARVWSIPASRAKNNVAHDVPLNMLAVAELEKLAGERMSDFVFSTTGRTPPSGWSKAKSRLDAILIEEIGGMSAWRFHDLRRTMATGFQRLGIRYEVTEAVLNHVSGARSGVAGVYQRHNWSTEKRDALGRWGAALERMFDGTHTGLLIAPDDNVTPLTRVAGAR